ncbi:unnamed protein product [Brachionus calyciflorus]|uniref:Transcription factor TFIIIC triple barrel domain-containing protein n=1 Tax=Brachionus calyciflorus TaxID=104777 RepID=A0A813ZVA6_9BILA|nr:unnamed protein product [Brachionus calyciflorus]
MNENSVTNNNLENQNNFELEAVSEQEIEKESLVLIQFTDLDDANYCEKFSYKFNTIEITQPNPIIQIGNRVYQGEYQNNIGTYLFFEENKSNDRAPQANYNYSGKSFKKLVLTRLFVEERKSN